MPEMLLF